VDRRTNISVAILTQQKDEGIHFLLLKEALERVRGAVDVRYSGINWA